MTRTQTSDISQIVHFKELLHPFPSDRLCRACELVCGNMATSTSKLLTRFSGCFVLDFS
jgi:hypothetical protein